MHACLIPPDSSRYAESGHAGAGAGNPHDLAVVEAVSIEAATAFWRMLLNGSGDGGAQVRERRSVSVHGHPVRPGVPGPVPMHGRCGDYRRQERPGAHASPGSCRPAQLYPTTNRSS